MKGVDRLERAEGGGSVNLGWDMEGGHGNEVKGKNISTPPPAHPQKCAWNLPSPQACEEPKAGCHYAIFPRHTLPNLDQIYAISEVIIISNDHHQHQNIISTDQQTTGLMQILNNNIQLLSFGVIVSAKSCFRKYVCLLFPSSSYMENNFLPNR